MDMMKKTHRAKDGGYIPKIPTGISGLDLILNKGLPKRRTSLCVGSAGSGKTILGCEFLWRGIERYDENAVFVTFEESKERIIRNTKSFGWDLRGAEQAGRLAFVEFATSIMSNDIVAGNFDLTIIINRIEHAVKKVKAKRVLIDSISALFDQLGEKEHVRKLLLDMAEYLNQLGVTTLMTAERYEEYGPLSAYRSEAFVSDSVLILRHVLDEERVRRTMQVLKMRGSRHKQGEFPFTIAGEGVVVMPLVGMELESKSSNIRISSGSEVLDRLCGGGFFQDSVILVSGPTGTGKTLMTTQFIEASCARGEKAILFAYEESKDQLFRNGQSWGIDLKKRERQGLLRVICEYPESMGPEDHLLRVKKEINIFKPKRIACDSLSAMERVFSVRSFREFVIALSSFIKKREIAGFFTNTTATLLGGESITETHISTLTDSIILLRYVETGGQMRRGITVIKMRGSWHDKDIREYEVNDQGMQIKKPFRNIESIMTGSARSVSQLEREELKKLVA
jgi:circadian clock protein KaiC